jgi:hypothetical protein
MKRLIGVLLFIVSPIVFAHSCPVLMKDIDAKMGTAQGMSNEKMIKVKQLRADGERLHKEGKHDESMKALQEAQSLLGT